jgi:TrwC relaxase
VDSRGSPWQPRAPRRVRGAGPELSKRTGQIDAELDRLAAHGRERTPRLVKWAVQGTRRPKQHETPDTLYDRWRAEAAERGVDPDTFVRTVEKMRIELSSAPALWKPWRMAAVEAVAKAFR